MLEWKLQLTEQTTHFNDPALTRKNYELLLVFTFESIRKVHFRKLNERINELNFLKTIDVKVEWREIKDAVLLTDEAHELLFKPKDND